MRILRASLVALLLLCLLTGAADAQTCTPLQGVGATLEGAQNFCRTSTGGTFTAYEVGGGISTHQWVYGPSSSGPWTVIAGATGTSYRLTGSDFSSTGLWWIAVTSTPECGSPVTGGAQTVTVNDTLPSPQIYGDDQICGDAASAIAQAAAPWDSYSWSITHGTFIAGANGCGDDPTKRCISFRPDGTGEVHLSLTVTAGSCSSNTLRAVSLVENTPPPLSVSSPVCPGSQGSAVTSQFPAGVRTWSVTNAHIDSDLGDHIFFTADGNGPVDVTLTFTDANGCSSTSTGRANLAGTKPVITLGTPACAYNGTASANGGWDSYDWSITNGSITSGQGTPNISFSGSGGGPMVLTVNGRANYSTFSCTTASDPVTVPTLPTPAITLGTPDICLFGTDTATAPEGYANYWWSLNNGYITAGDGTNSIRFSRGGYPNDPNDPITVTLFVGDANGCSAPQATATVPTRTIPAPTITLGTPDICPFGTDTATVPAQYANYWWSLNNGYVMSGDGTNSITFSRGGGMPGNNDPITITLYVQDADGCPAPQATVTVPTRTISAPVITLGTPDICLFGTDTATVPAEYANYWWSLNNGYIMSGDGTNSITFSRGGGMPGNDDPITITLYVQDANGCPAPQSTVTVPTRSIAAPVITLGTPDICAFGTDTATVPPQYANYWWSINNGYIMSGDGTNSIRFSRGGYLSNETDPITITLYVQDANGCPAPQTTVTVPTRSIPAPVITLGTPDICKFGTNTASVPPQYANYWWSITNGSIMSGDGTNSITFSPGGGVPGNNDPIIITLYVEDANGCPAQQSPVTVPIRILAPPVITASGSTTLCAGGSVTLTAPDGFSYSWSNGATTRAITVTQPGDYFVTVSDTSGCDATSSPTTVTADATPAPTISASGPTSLCPGGGVTLTASSGASYAWSTGATTQSIVVTTSGDYSVTVTNANGCSAVSAPTAVTVNANPTAAITPSGPTTFCTGGSVTLTASNGASYAWSTGATTQSIVATSTGDYSVTVTDANGCSATSAATTVTLMALPDATISAPSSVCASTYGDNARVASVFNGAYAWTISGGTITSGAGTYQIAFKPSGSDPVTLGVTVTNSNGCAASSTRVVDVHSVPKPAITPSGAASFCNSGVLTAPVGYAAYSWKRDGGQISGASAQTFVATQSGTYSVIVFDATNCWVESDPVSITVSTTPVASISAQNSVCAGSTYGAVSAGTAASYQWSVTNGTIVDGQATQVIHYTSGASGNVTLTLTVANAQGCSDTQSIDIPIANVQAAITPSGPLTICPGGSVTLTASAGASYIWSNNTYAQSTTITVAGSYSVRVFDAAGCYAQSQSVTVSVASPSATITPSGPTTFCAGGSVTLSAPAGYSYSWSTGATTQSITVDQSNSYTVTVQDGNGCTASSSAAVTVNPVPQVVFTTPSVVCGTSEAAQEVQPLGTDLTYDWTITNGAITQNAGHRVYFTANAGAAEVVLRVTITNSAGCSTSDSITLPVHTPPSATITPSGPTTFCAGGNVTLTAPVGMSSYSWSTGATTQSITVSTPDNYTVTVRDANFCSTQSSPVAVTVNPLPAPTIATSGPTTFCAGDSVTLTASAGFASYRWNTGETTQSITVSSSDNYSVTVGDGNCSGVSAPTAVTVRPLPTATVSGTAAICPGGSATITAALTGTAPWTVTWSDHVTQTINSGTTASHSVNPSATTTYMVTSLADANCSGTSSGTATVTVKTLPTATVSGDAAICPGASATITAALTGTAPFSVTWSDNVTQTINSGTTASRSVSPAATTTYTVTSVSDAASCPATGSGSATVTRNAAASITTQPSNVTTTRNTNITLSVVAAGTAPISYRWFNGSGTAISGATSSSYTTSFTKKGTNTFYVEVWNACNTTHVRSNTVTVTVN